MDNIYTYINGLLIYSKEYFLLSILIYFIFLLIYSIFSLPGLLIFIVLSGYLFGIYYGYLISVISITFGSLIFFFLSKYFFQYFFSNFYTKYSKNIDTYISKSTTEYFIMFRMIPGLPLFLQNLILSLINISITKFVLVTCVGFTPFILSSVLIGNKIKDIQSINGLKFKDIFTWDLIIFIIVIIFLLLMRIRFKKISK